MKRQLARLLSLALILCVWLMGSSTAVADSLSGNYKQDTLNVIEQLREAIDLPDGTAEKAAAQTEARKLINDFTALKTSLGSVLRYRSLGTRRTITTPKQACSDGDATRFMSCGSAKRLQAALNRLRVHH